MSELVIGLTGGIGSGKTAVSDAFAAHGITIVDADVIARDVVMPGTPGLAQITGHFGKGILLNDGSLDRHALRERVFHHPEEKAWLNGLLHPLIRESMTEAVSKATSPYCILSVPLLVENGLTTMVSRVLVVDCPESLQLARAMRRDGSSEATIRNIMASQASRDQRLAAADDVVDNSGTLDELTAQVTALHRNYLAMANVKAK
ncbi:dephospho-CoA kinase [Alteromonas sp. CYL-A6]|uniref:dephospho-CoA kinase n=1 Tax=Alteromonas nitratireducens TaxID=3390813 RepID=UPI0034A85395